MKRLASSLWLDFRLQFRNGFYYAATFVTVVTVIILRQFPNLDFKWLLPAMLLSNLLIGTFYFFGGLVLLEKKEGTLEAQVVTPIRTWEYLLSKVITLTGLSILENVAVVIFVYGFDFKPLPLVLGVSVASVMYCLFGFIAVARYDSINEYLFPSMLYTGVLSLVFLNYFELWESWLFYLHPLQAPLLILKSAFNPIKSWQVVYGLLYSALSVGLIFLLSQKMFYRFIIQKEGVR